MITVATAPTLKVNQFQVEAAMQRAGAFFAFVQPKREDGTNFGEELKVIIGPGSGQGIRYNAAGAIERFTKTDAAITVAAAFNAYAGAPGNFRAKADALEAWLQARGLLP